MKSFYVSASGGASAPAYLPAPSPSEHTRARIAVYDGPAAAPRIEEVCSEDTAAFIERLSARTYELARAQGGPIPYSVIREISENFIHADFAEPVVSVLDSGKTIRFADQGPGIPDKAHAVMPGYTTASGTMKRYIRGVGSGLPIVRDYLSVFSGSLVIEDNLGSGAVVTIYTNPADRSSHTVEAAAYERPVPTVEPSTQPALLDSRSTDPDVSPQPVARPRLSTRQKQVLALVMESGSAGPSLVSRELGVGISTAYRDLASLEDLDLIAADGGKRQLTPNGLSYLDELTSGT